MKWHAVNQHETMPFLIIHCELNQHSILRLLRESEIATWNFKLLPVGGRLLGPKINCYQTEKFNLVAINLFLYHFI